MWSITGNLNTTRTDHTATLLPNGKVLVAGGWDGASAITGAVLYEPETGAWSSTGNLNAARCLHTATLLQNGKVLVAGGTDDGDLFSTLASAELYDPDSGTWSITASLSEPRVFHTATLLKDSKVLVVGGDGGYLYGQSDSEELYDPKSGEWSHTGNLNTIRYGHISTILPSGKVLVAGGGYSSTGGPVNFLNSAELYDPATGIWYRIGDLKTARYGHTATLLSNGKVLLAGGSNSAGALNTAELSGAASGTIAIPRITGASPVGKRLFVFGENFDPGAVILLNGEEQKTKNDDQNPTTALIGKKTGKKVKTGDILQVRNPNGTLSDEFTFTGL
jgi:N-acetylneuraminic acid mutarotase